MAEAESAETARVEAAVCSTMEDGVTETKATPAASTSPVADGAEKLQEAAMRAADTTRTTSRLSVGAQVRNG